MNEKKPMLAMLDDPALALDAEDRPVEIVDCPEWKMRVRVRGMNVMQRLSFAEAMPRKHGTDEVDYSMLKPHLLVFCIVGKNGEPLFKPADVNALAQRSVAAIDRLYGVASRLCGMGEERVEAVRKN